MEQAVPCNTGGETPDTSAVGGSCLKKRNVGRAARRRRRKVRDIQAHLALPESPTLPLSACQSLPLVLPLDRSRVRPAVRFHRLANCWNCSDETALQVQLGYVPGNVIRIAARWSDVVAGDSGKTNAVAAAAPVVIQLYPLVCREPHAGGKTGGLKFKARKRKRQDTRNGNEANELPVPIPIPVTQYTEDDQSDQQCDSLDTASKTDATSSLFACGDVNDDDKEQPVVEPFPTIYWLTHPVLSNCIAQLERDGYGLKYEQRLATDPTTLVSMQRAHHSYSVERVALLTASDAAWIHDRGWTSALSAPRGVAGSTNPRAVKCLHAHTAHYLSGCVDNVVGQWVMESLPSHWHVSTSSHIS